MDNQSKSVRVKSIDELSQQKFDAVFVAPDESTAVVFDMFRDEYLNYEGMFYYAKNCFLGNTFAILITTELPQGAYLEFAFDKPKMNYPCPYTGSRRTPIQIAEAVSRAGVENQKALKELWKKVEFNLGWPKVMSPEMKKAREDYHMHEDANRKNALTEFGKQYIECIPGLVRQPNSWGEISNVWKLQFAPEIGAYITVTTMSRDHILPVDYRYLNVSFPGVGAKRIKTECLKDYVELCIEFYIKSNKFIAN